MNSQIMGGLGTLPDAASYMTKGPLHAEYVYNAGWPLYFKTSQLFGIKPVDLWVFCDESMYTLNDGYLQMSMNKPGFPDCPANYHGGVNCFSFADGHVEEHKWRATLMSVPYAYGVVGTYWTAGKGSVSAADLDWQWLIARTASRSDLP